MLNAAKYVLVSLAAAAGGSRRHLSGTRKAMIIPPAGPGSVGDAAMLTSIVATLRARGYSQVNFLEVEKGCRWQLDAPEDRRIPAADFIDYGSRLNLASLLFELGGYSDLICVGADILDGIYDEDRMANRLELLHRAALMGVRTTVVGSSFSDHPSPRCVSLLRALPAEVRIFARDAYSHERMVRTLDRPIGTSADVAFLLEAAEERLAGSDILGWIAQEAAGGRPILAVNANNLHEREHPTLVEDYARLVEGLIERGVSVVLLPHDSRTARSDQFIAGEIHRLIDERSKPHARAFHPETPGQLQALLSRLDLVVTGRMHAAIIACGSHTPAMSFAYANKFEGFYRHLDLDPAEMILSLKELHEDPGQVVAKIMAVQGHSGQLKQHIAARIAPLREAAARNFSFAAREGPLTEMPAE